MSKKIIDINEGNETNAIPEEISYADFRKLEDEGVLTFHHSAYFWGYVSRVKPPVPEPYKGRFGRGYVLRLPNRNSNSYSFIEYYVYRNKDKKGAKQ